MLPGWLVVVTNPEAVEDLRLRLDDELLLSQGFDVVSIATAKTFDSETKPPAHLLCRCFQVVMSLETKHCGIRGLLTSCVHG